MLTTEDAMTDPASAYQPYTPPKQAAPSTTPKPTTADPFGASASGMTAPPTGNNAGYVPAPAAPPSVAPVGSTPSPAPSATDTSAYIPATTPASVPPPTTADPFGASASWITAPTGNNAGYTALPPAPPAAPPPVAPVSTAPANPFGPGGGGVDSLGRTFGDSGYDHGVLGGQVGGTYYDTPQGRTTGIDDNKASAARNALTVPGFGSVGQVDQATGSITVNGQVIGNALDPNFDPAAISAKALVLFNQANGGLLDQGQQASIGSGPLNVDLPQIANAPSVASGSGDATPYQMGISNTEGAPSSVGNGVTPAPLPPIAPVGGTDVARGPSAPSVLQAGSAPAPGYTPPPIADGAGTFGGVPPVPSVAPVGTPVAPAPTTAANGVLGSSVATTPTDPNNPLTASTISRAPGTDRFKTALDQWNQWNASTNPAYEASLRDANRMAAAGGAIGSGQLQTSIGDLAANRALAQDTQRNTYLDKALEDSIGDAFKDVGIAQQQQGFQKGQEDTAFTEGVTLTQLDDTLTNSAFGRSLQQLLVGSQGNPSDIQLALSQIFGSQASAASDALARMVSNAAANGGGSSGGANSGLTQALVDWAKEYGGGGGNGGQAPPNSGVPITTPDDPFYDDPTSGYNT